MPWAQCPDCATKFHLNVGNTRKWYEENWPDYKVGDVVPAKCLTCWQAGRDSAEPEQFGHEPGN